MCVALDVVPVLAVLLAYVRVLLLHDLSQVGRHARSWYECVRACVHFDFLSLAHSLGRSLPAAIIVRAQNNAFSWGSWGSFMAEERGEG